ncbi:DUF1788 domain-containing protein [uncultured Clostridium sp.]|uniref:DUF1788 domain-containing protein n=1 Tax=uncultured Clostridium sp. TaxID=59620 RepID=UPI0025FF63CA|nr:DUF1788 domain-containing protein [uncultured Clostridium sp.]MDU4325903.1 DUF1788 domain-containing protein [Clostridium celatum]
MKSIYERLDEILPIISEPHFRENKGLGNEVGFYIFDYSPKDEMIVRERIPFIKSKAQSSHNINIVEIDLYEAIIEILESKGYLKKNFEMEEKKGSEFVMNATKKALRLTLSNDLLIKYIVEKSEGCDILFLIGVGKAWPLVRSHTILNNLHKEIEDMPLVMFFPGSYDGGTLMLFEEFKDDNYYRAFPLVDKY